MPTLKRRSSKAFKVVASAIFCFFLVDQRSSAQDYAGLATTATTMATSQIMMGGNNIAMSTCHCAGGCSGAPAWGTCGMMALNVAALGGAIYGMVMDLQAQNASTGASTGAMTLPNGATYNPDLPLGTQLSGCTGSACTACASNDPLCSANPVGALQSAITAANNALAANPDLALPAGMTPADLQAQADQGLAQLGAAMDALANGTPLAGAQQLSDKMGGKAATNGSAYGDGSGALGQTDLGDLFGGADGGKGKVGPLAQFGLGKILWNGLLDMLDDETGKSLSLWQRATRRYQGDRGMRAFAMSRMESIRKQALKMVKNAFPGKKIASASALPHNSLQSVKKDRKPTSAVKATRKSNDKQLLLRH